MINMEYERVSQLENEVKAFLISAPGPGRFHRGPWPYKVGEGQKQRYWRELDDAHEKCRVYLAALEPFQRTLKGISDLRKELLERRNALREEIRKMAPTMLTREEQIIFGKDVQDLDRFHGRFGKKFVASQRPAERVGEHLKEDRIP